MQQPRVLHADIVPEQVNLGWRGARGRGLLINPPMTLDDLLDRLARVVSDFVAAVREHAEAA